MNESRALARLVVAAVAALTLAGAAFAQSTAPAKASPAKPVPASAKTVAADSAACYACHAPIREFHAGNKHASVGCASCHDGLPAHLTNATSRPVTKTDPAVCGGCHENQFRTMYTMNPEKTARKSKSLAGGPSPNPAFDKLMGPHGFTREHNEPRSHAFMLYDQFVVDRAFGGRFENKEGWRGLAKFGGNFKVWDVLEDKYPGQDHKAFKPGTAAAANPVCMSCKTADHILDWAYLGDPVPGAKWSRTSKVQEFVKDTNHALNCFFCHDPHSAKPRIIRDGLIQALTRPEKDTLWHSDPRGAKIEVKDFGLRGYTRKIATLERYDMNLQCGQCHVEYNCNPGTDPTTGKPIGMTDARTNHFPFKKVADIGKHYTDLKFRDFKHGITGALLWKAQHPDVENYYGTKHQKAGVECSSCHMPKVKDAKTGKTFTSHWQTSPKHYIKETCLTCHSDWKAEQAVYVIDSLKNRFQGKLRAAEYALTRFVDKFEEAKGLGVDEATLDKARDIHYNAHIHWEWWTASNGAHFHNHDEAVESINKGIGFSNEGIKLLDDAMAKRREAVRPVAAAAPAPAPAAAPAK
ncbi:MAG TPA: ammonia-forming cytochrome c nitrite reductase subunit c552 [Casimicrobiaceae bacterium]|nr:ammonia-forming cytochrome c nitrite reductase subunit c552 [Casimicrobiaceae bacterium]